MTEPIVDPAVVDAARSGDAAALDRLLTACQPDLRRFARRTCVRADDVEDAVQNALWVLYRRVGTLRTLAAVSGWLFQVVRRECLRLARGRRPTRPLDEAAARPAVTPDVPLARDLAAALASLDPADREIILLRDVREFTGPEAAARLGISLAAAKTRLHRARRLMRERLTDYQPR